MNFTVQNDWQLCQFDVSNTFLHGDIDYEVFMEPPDVSHINKDKLWKVKKAVYGLRQSPNLWFETLASTLKEMGFTQSDLEPCLFSKVDSLIPVYVDDSFIAAPNSQILNDIKSRIKQKFPIKDLGFPSTFLGMSIPEPLPVESNYLLRIFLLNLKVITKLLKVNSCLLL